MEKSLEKKANKESYIRTNDYRLTWSEGFWLLLFLFVLTQPFTTDFVSKVLVKYVFRHFPSEGFTITGAILWIILFLGALVSLWRKSWKTVYIVKDISFLIGSMGFMMFLIYHRCSSALFIFYPLFPNDISSIRMVDLPLIFLSITTIFLIANHFRKRCTTDFDNEKKQNLRSYIQADVPIKDLDADEFNRKKVFESLLDTISSNSISEDKSIAIALVNRWGEGKTSFLEILDKELKEKRDALVVSFNPWLSSQPDNLTLDFFNTLDEALSPYIYTGRLFRQYAQSLTKIDTVYNPLLYLPRQWFGHRSNKDYFDRIKKLIKKFDKRIFILIDDMDRLHPKEVFELLRMIRNSASFPHMIFIVPFEREYVVQALEDIQIHNGNEYLKKIFDVEVTLPPIMFDYIQKSLEKEFQRLLELIFTNQKEDEKTSESDKLLNQFRQCIGKNIGVEEIIDETESSIPPQEIKKKNERYNKIHQSIRQEIKNKRDVVRLVNSLFVILKDNHRRIYLPDLLILELIKMIDIREYGETFEKYENFSNAMFWSKFKEPEGVNSNINKRKEDDLSDSVPEKKEGQTNHINEIIVLRELLFNEPDSDFNSDNAFCHPLNFSNYLEFQEEGLSLRKLLYLFDNYKNSGVSDNLIQLEKVNPIMDRLKLHSKGNEFKSQMKTYLEISLFYLRETQSQNNYGYFRIALNLSKLMIAAIIKNQEKIENFIEIIEGQPELSNKTWIPELNRELIDTISKQDVENISKIQWEKNEEQVKLLVKELQRINEEYLLNAIGEKQPFDYIEKIFWKCIEKYDEDREPIFTKNAICIYRKYINHEPREYLKHFIRMKYPMKYIKDNKRFRHIPAYYYEQIFSSFKDWLKFIERQVDPNLFQDIDKFMNIYNEKSDRNENDPIVILYASSNQSRHDMKLTYQDHLKVNSECLPLNYAEENESLI